MAWTTVYKILSEIRRSKKGAKAGRNKRVRADESESESDEVEEVQMEEDEKVQEVAGDGLEVVAPQPPKKRRSKAN